MRLSRVSIHRDLCVTDLSVETTSPPPPVKTKKKKQHPKDHAMREFLAMACPYTKSSTSSAKTRKTQN